MRRNSADNTTLVALFESVAHRLLGAPNARLSHPKQGELRYGTNGSLSVVVAGDKAGTWFDHERGIGGGVLDLIQNRLGLVGEEAVRWLDEEFGADLRRGDEEKPRESRRIAATYDYLDETGRLLFQVVRFTPKDFRQRRPDGYGGWAWDTHGVELVPYRLPELREAVAAGRTIFVVEGEKDVDALRCLGLDATCNPMGAARPAPGKPYRSKWPAHFARHFHGASVVILPDNDDAGRAHAHAVRENLRPVAGSVRVLELPGLSHKQDVSDWIAAGGTAGQLMGLAGQPGPDDGTDAGQGTGDDTMYSGEPDALTEFTDPTTLVGVEPPPRAMIVQGWLPEGAVASLYGAPGVGKTLLAQVLGTAVAAGRPFLGLETAQCNVLAVFCEDDGNELHRRQVAINAGLDIGMQDLSALRYQGRYGKLNVMAASRNGVVELTSFYSTIRAAALQFGARLVILDNIAQLFAGDENNRSEVTQFVNALGALAQEIHGAVLLLGHPGKGAGSEYSGSTAWDAAVRTRWILERPKSSDDEQEAAEMADLRVLRKPKANYGSTGDEITLRWDRGTFRLEGPATFKDTVDRIEEQVRERSDEDVFLACLDALNQQGRAVSHAVQAQNYAPRVMSRLPQAKGVGPRRLRHAMERLFAAGKIQAGMEVGRRSNRHTLFGIGRVESKPEPTDAPCATARHRPTQPSDFAAPSGCAVAAPERAEVSAKSLNSLRHGACARAPIDTTYLSVPSAGGGGTDPCGAARDLDDDAEVF